MEQIETNRYEKFQHTLSKSTVNVKDLRKLSWNGIPSKFRAQTWKILLGYLPANSSRRHSTLKRKRDEYLQFSAHSFISNPQEMNEYENDILRQVHADVPRTAPIVGLFRDDRVQRGLERLLFTWAMRHPASSYVQGMNDIVTPFFSVFLGDNFGGLDLSDGGRMAEVSDEMLEEVEADAYWCFSKVLSGILNHYTPDQPGIQKNIHRLKQLVCRIDNDLSSHFDDEGVDVMHFSFKWMNCLLVRDMPFRYVIRMWDTYISEDEKTGFADFHVYVCAAYMCHFSPQLKKMDYEDLYCFWQSFPTSQWCLNDVERLLSQAYIWYTIFNESEAHLSGSTFTVKPKRVVIEDIKDKLPVSLMRDVDFLCEMFE